MLLLHTVTGRCFALGKGAGKSFEAAASLLHAMKMRCKFQNAIVCK
jgi:hypothetical protein